MTKKLILVSPAGERLVVDVGQGTVQSVKSDPADDVTHVIVEPKTEASPSSSAAAPTPLLPEPPPDLDIIMSFVGGLPAPLVSARPDGEITGPVTVRRLARLLREAPEDGVRTVVLKHDHDR